MRALAIVTSLVFACAAFGACVNTVTVNSGIDAESVAGAVFITLDGQCGQTIPTINPGDDIQVVVGTAQFQADTKHVIPTALFTRIDAVAGGPAAEDPATLAQIADASAATVTIGSATFAATIANPNEPLKNITRYEWSIGPATKSGANPTATANTTDQGAFRLLYDGELARPGFLGHNADAKFQSIATLSLDTTNSSDPGYVDNNRIAVGLQSLSLPNTSVFAQTTVGVNGQYTKSLHQSASDTDLVAKLSTWIPVLPAKTIFGSTPGFISAPLAVSLSYGYRDKRMPGVKSSRGQTGEATATYYLYAFDNYQLTLEGTWTLNDLSDRAANIPKTARLYKIQVAYLSNPANGFEVQTSFENGKIGPLLTKVRQYYIGMAIKKFSMSGGSTKK